MGFGTEARRGRSPHAQARAPLLLGFTVRVDIPGWLQFEAPGREPAEFFGITEDAAHVCNRSRIAFRGESKERVDELTSAIRVLGALNIEGLGFESPVDYAVYCDDPAGNALEICFRSQRFNSKAD